MTALVIPLPWSTPPLSGNHVRGNPKARGHERQPVLDAAWYAIRQARAWPFTEPVNISLHYQLSTRRRQDSDNLFPTYKACQDALVHAGIIPDDGWRHVRRASCEIHPADGTPARMWLEVEPCV